ncbi:MAG: hypothetical protein JKX98_00010 [Alcanivoracaceae bacterium]|nr:hypothetical protein [Alcanivoracaceae bacterium]
MKSAKEIFLLELEQDIRQERKLIYKEALVILLLIVLSIIREVYLHE